MSRDRGAQIQQTHVRWVPGFPLLDRLDARLRRDLRCVEIGLAGREVDNILSGSLASLGLLVDRDRFRRLEVSQILRQRHIAAARRDGLGGARFHVADFLTARVRWYTWSQIR